MNRTGFDSKNILGGTVNSNTSNFLGMNALIIRFAGDSAPDARVASLVGESGMPICIMYSHNKCTKIRLRQLTCREGGVDASSAHVALQVDQ
jgi:hypothetical protein